MTNAEKVKQIKMWLHDLSLEEVREVNTTSFELSKVKAAARAMSVKSAIKLGTPVHVIDGRQAGFDGVVMDIMIKKARVKENATGKIWLVPLNMITPTKK